MIALVAEYTVRSIVLGLLVFLTLKALRVRDPRLERAAWRMVLATVVAMPVLSQLMSLSPVPAAILSASYTELVTLPKPDSITYWGSALPGIVASISGLLVMRHAVGVARCWAMRRRATRLAPYGALEIRVSSDVSSPATVFSTILVPADFASWPPEAQRLAIAHERSHVISRDFYVQWLAQIYRSLFWFNPFAWWLASRLALLNEHVSDDAAIDAPEDRDQRTAYAKVLLSLAQRATTTAQLVPMIRNDSLSVRIERILRPSGAGRASALKCLLVTCALIPILTATAAIRSSPEVNTATQVILPRSNPAKPLSQPQYPSASRRAGEAGTVVLKLHVLEDGSVGDAAVVKSSGYPDLDYAAFYEAFRWRLEPGTVDGAPSRMWGRFAVTFKLADD
ncbi:MAG: M56 family metallopeptidase [Pseudomonadota bacterium]|nr:M56 family metallopeptidase [Pseudomonadota bacterium]